MFFLGNRLILLLEMLLGILIFVDITPIAVTYLNLVMIEHYQHAKLETEWRLDQMQIRMEE